MWPRLEVGGVVRWEEARELARPLLLDAAARLLPPPGRLLARELGGSSIGEGTDIQQPTVIPWPSMM